MTSNCFESVPVISSANIRQPRPSFYWSNFLSVNWSGPLLTHMYSTYHTNSLFCRDSKWRSVEHRFDEANGKNAWLCLTPVTHTHRMMCKHPLSRGGPETQSCELSSLLNRLRIATSEKKSHLMVSSQFEVQRVYETHFYRNWNLWTVSIKIFKNTASPIFSNNHDNQN